MIRLLFLCAALALAGCNLVTSDAPLFTAADEDRSAPLRDGVWLSFDEDCPPPAAPAAPPPACAEEGLVQDGRPVDPEHPAGKDEVLVAGGDPRILQVQLRVLTQVKAPEPEDFVYAAMRPTRRDAMGRIVEARVWFVQCGPPPPPPRSQRSRLPEPGDFLTRSPVEGLVVDRQSGSCKARDSAALRRAARASESWDEDKVLLRWLREAGPADLQPAAK